MLINDSEYENNSFTFYGPMEMVFDDDNTTLESTEIKTILSILLVIIMLMSVVGNLCTCTVIIRYKTMRTPTNGYLFNLAVTDLLISLMVPIDLYTTWLPDYYPLGLIGCHVHLFLINGMTNCSVITILTFTIERYLVITKPFLCQTLSKTSRVYKIVGFIWIASFCFCLPEVLTADTLEWKKNIYCFTTLSNGLRILVAIQVFIFYAVPIATISILYTLIALKLKRSKKRRSPVNGNQRRDKAVRMLAAVAGLFFFCWSPLLVMRVMMIFPKFSYDAYFDMWRVINYLTMVNGYLSTVVNPILYSLMSQKFRQAFKDFFRGRKTSSHTAIERIDKILS